MKKCLPSSTQFWLIVKNQTGEVFENHFNILESQATITSGVGRDSSAPFAATNAGRHSKMNSARKREAEEAAGRTSNVFHHLQRCEAEGSCCVAATNKDATIETGPF